jgi:hypothetical protein
VRARLARYGAAVEAWANATRLAPDAPVRGDLAQLAHYVEARERGKARARFGHCAHAAHAHRPLSNLELF